MSRRGDNSARVVAREVAQAIEQLTEKRDKLAKEISFQHDRLRAVNIPVKAFRDVMSRRLRPRDQVEERDAEIRKIEEWLSGLPAPSGTKPATRARTRDEEAEGDDE